MSGYLLGVLAIYSVNVILAYAVFLSSAAGVTNLGTAGFAAIGAYFAAYLSNTSDIPLWVDVVLGAGVAGMIGFVVAFPILRVSGVYIVLATFAFSEVVAGAILNLDAVGGAAGYPVLQFTSTYVLIAVAVVLAIAISYLFRTRFGLAMRAVHDDERVADLFGVNVRWVKVLAFAGSAAAAGVAGSMYGFHYSYLEAQNFNMLYSAYVLLAVLLGGTQTAFGPLVGATVFTLLPEVLRSSAQLRYLAFGVLIVLVIALRPEGIVTRTMVERLRKLVR